MRTPFSPGLVLLGSLLLTGCAGSVLRTIEARKVPSSSSPPEIHRVMDLGNVDVQQGTALDVSRSDGKAVIGELLLVQGSHFGKQPRVTIGGRATEVLAHVSGGGVMVRVPWGIDPGQVEIEVAHPQGRGVLTYPVQRLGLVLTDGELIPFEVKADGGAALAQGRVALLGGQELALSQDGSVVYVGGTKHGKVTLWVVDLTATPPRILSEKSFPGTRLVDLETAAQSAMGVLVSDTHIVYFDTRTMLNPAFYTPHRLPDAVTQKQVLAAAMGGQGRWVALLLADLNRVALLDASKPGVLPSPTLADVLPDARLQVVSDLRFSADGHSVWVVSGDTTRSIAGGYQPAKLTLLRLAQGRLAVHRTWDITDKVSVPMLALARGEPIPPGTAIRDEPSSSSVYLPGYPSDVLKPGGLEDGLQGQLLRSSLSRQSAEVLARGPWLLTSVDVVGKTEVLLALACRVKGGAATRVLLHGAAWRGAAPTTLDLGPVAPQLLRTVPLWIGTVRAQP